MSHVIIGTAGHIDHGKTTLIKRLTGIETDRLKEEQKRGITIELGFAYFDLPGGRRAGIVDVPGHEKFIKHMLAGAGGIDLVLLVISAEEGIMPQTREHIDILQLLGIKSGIVCLTKCDLVDKEWLEMMQQDIEEKLEGTFLKGAPMVPIGFKDDAGLEVLKTQIDHMTAELRPRNSNGKARLPVDRVFSLTGFGTVVTGTLIEGSISVGDKLNLYPSGLEARVRNLQVHSEDVGTAYSGQRVAVNIANLSTQQISRGNVLAPQGSMKESYIVDANVDLLPNSPRTLHNWSRVRLYHGSNEVLARLVLLGKEELKPGESAFVQLRLEEKTAVKYGDRFVLRFYSPLETVGGGVVLDPNANKHKRFKDEVIEELMNKNTGDESSIVEDIIYARSSELLELKQIVEYSGFDEEKLKTILEPVIEDGRILVFGGRHYFHRAFLDAKNEEVLEILNRYYEKNPLKMGLTKDELRTKLFGKIKPKVFDEVCQFFYKGGSVEQVGRIVSTKGRKIVYDKRQSVLKDALLKYYEGCGFSPDNLTDVLAKVGISKKDFDVYESLVDSGELLRLNDALNLSKPSYERAVSILDDEISISGEITLARFRDLTVSSRKIAVAILDYFDSVGLTYRDGDVRRKK